MVGREGERRGGDHWAAGVAGAVGVFLGLGAVLNFLADAKENNTQESAPTRLNIGSLSGSNLSLHP